VLREGFEGARGGIIGCGEGGEDLLRLAEGDARAVLERAGVGKVGGGEGRGVVGEDVGVGVRVEVCAYCKEFCCEDVSSGRPGDGMGQVRHYLLRRRKGPLFG
jgi:hypothetical protein